MGGEFGFSPLQRLLIACRALLFYAGKLLFPWPLIFNYPRWEPGVGLAGWLAPALVVFARQSARWVRNREVA